MTLIATGLNHKTAPLTLREKFAIAPLDQPAYVQSLLQHTPIEEVALVSTCNRTELYCVGDGDALWPWLAQRHQVPQATLEKHLYAHHDHKAVHHLMRVASGLDSMVLGEPQILGQVKHAYREAAKVGSVGRELHRLFRHVLGTTKRVRTQSDIGVNSVSIAYTAVELIKQCFPALADQSVLLIGAGQTIELVARHLQTQGVTQFMIANRNQDNAVYLAKQFDGKGVSIAEIPDHIAKADIVISATACPIPFIGKGMIETAMAARNGAPMVIVDLAVPRDVEPEVKAVPDISLFNVDDLQTVIDQNRQAREDAAQKAEAIIALELDHYLRCQRALRSAETIKHYRDAMHALKNEELQRATQQLTQGTAAEDVLTEFSHRLLQKVLHHPTEKLRQAGIDTQEDLLKLVDTLYSV